MKKTLIQTVVALALILMGPSGLSAQETEGSVTEIRGDEAVVDLGTDSGVEEGSRFEIRSQEMVKQYNLDTAREEMMPSNRVTAVVEVIRVGKKTSLVLLGKGDRARVGDRARLTTSDLTRTNWFPGYERNLNRIQARIAPFVGIDTLTVGTFASLMYDRTFSFPMRVEAGFRNVGFHFGDSFGAPFQFDVVPSYDTDYFEVGLGGGYQFSANERKRGFSFLQKVRLGTVDGLNFTMWNSFIYTQGDLDEVYSPVTMGADCVPTSEQQGEFAWNGFDAQLAVPLTDRVTLATEWSFSQAGWLFGDIGIRTRIRGNGGKGTVIIPVTIGGGVVIDYEEDGDGSPVCDPESKKYEKSPYRHSDEYGGPVVSIGLDYRW